MEHSNFRNSIQQQSGFTLLEVLIAITILSFIAFSTYKMVDSNITTKEDVLREDAAIIQGVTAVGRLDADISQLYTPLFSSSKFMPTATTPDVYAENAAPSGNFDGRAKNGQLIPMFKSEEKWTVYLFTQANRRKIADSKESRFAWVKYSMRPMENDPTDPANEDKKNQGLYELTRQVIATDIFNSNLPWSEVKSQVLMKNIKTLEFTFWDEKTKKYVSNIAELNENKNLIRAIKLSAVWIDEDGNEQTIQKVFRVLNPYFSTKQDDLNTATNAPAPGGPGVPADTLAPGEGEVVQ